MILPKQHSLKYSIVGGNGDDVGVIVGVIVGVTVFVGVGVGVGKVYDTIFDVVGPPNVQVCIALKYIVSVWLPISKNLGDVQPPADVTQFILSVEYWIDNVPHWGAEIKLYCHVVPDILLTEFNWNPHIGNVGVGVGVGVLVGVIDGVGGGGIPYLSCGVFGKILIIFGLIIFTL